jgi:integrase
MKALVGSLLEKKCSRVVNHVEVKADGTEEQTKKTVEFQLSRPSLRIILSALTTCLTNAQREDGLLPSNPALALGKFTSTAKNRHESIDPLTTQEVPVFLQAVRETAPEFLPLFTVLIHCGLRSGEAAGLTWNDVDFTGKYLFIRQTWTPSGRVEKPKNGKERKVDLSDAAMATLQAHRRKLQKDCLKEGEPLPKWVFPNGEGKPHNMTNVRNRVFYRALQKAGLHRRPLHSTRHTFATLLLNQGESPVYVKDQMGHSSIKVTVDSYGKWIRSDDRRAVNKLPSIDSATPAAAATS